MIHNDRCLRDYDLQCNCRTLLLTVLIRPNFISALCLAMIQFSSPSTLTEFIWPWPLYWAVDLTGVLRNSTIRSSLYGSSEYVQTEFKWAEASQCRT